MLEKKFKSIESFKVDLKEQKFCISCHLPATKAVIFAIPGATLVERYCNECAKKLNEPRHLITQTIMLNPIIACIFESSSLIFYHSS